MVLNILFMAGREYVVLAAGAKIGQVWLGERLFSKLPLGRSAKKYPGFLAEARSTKHTYGSRPSLR